MYVYIHTESLTNHKHCFNRSSNRLNMTTHYFLTMKNGGVETRVEWHSTKWRFEQCSKSMKELE